MIALESMGTEKLSNECDKPRARRVKKKKKQSDR